MDEIISISMAQRQQTIGQAVQDYGKRLFGFIRSRVKNDEDAEDILQDVWYQLSSIIDIEPIEQLSSWLFRVSKNRIVDKYPKQSTLPLEDIMYENEEGELIFPDTLFTISNKAESDLDKKVFMDSLFKALDELPQQQKDVFIWNELEDMTLQQIADKTGEKLKTIISRKGYAVAHLRSRLKNLKY